MALFHGLVAGVAIDVESAGEGSMATVHVRSACSGLADFQVRDMGVRGQASIPGRGPDAARPGYARLPGIAVVRRGRRLAGGG